MAGTRLNQVFPNYNNSSTSRLSPNRGLKNPVSLSRAAGKRRLPTSDGTF